MPNSAGDYARSYDLEISHNGSGSTTRASCPGTGDLETAGHGTPRPPAPRPPPPARPEARAPARPEARIAITVDKHARQLCPDMFDDSRSATHLLVGYNVFRGRYAPLCPI